MPTKKFKATVVSTPGSQKCLGQHKSPGKGRPKKTVEKDSRRGRYKAHYDHRQLEDALLEVRNGNMSERAASKAFGVPRSTLKDRIGEKVTRQSGKWQAALQSSARTKESSLRKGC
jgi:DNA invertase Pin-like site-specific DNA recombinase